MKAVALVVIMSVAGTVDAQGATDSARSPEKDRQALIELENTWLAHQHEAAVLEKIIAADFLHPVAVGRFLSKTDHISYATQRQLPPDRTQHFEQLQVRVFGDTGILNGVVITTDSSGREAERSIFTDVFVFRHGQWQAVNAQENRVETPRQG